MFRLCPKCQLDSALLNAPGQDIEPHQIHHGAAGGTLQPTQISQHTQKTLHIQSKTCTKHYFNDAVILLWMPPQVF